MANKRKKPRKKTKAISLMRESQLRGKKKRKTKKGAGFKWWEIVLVVIVLCGVAFLMYYPSYYKNADLRGAETVEEIVNVIGVKETGYQGSFLVLEFKIKEETFTRQVPQEKFGALIAGDEVKVRYKIGVRSGKTYLDDVLPLEERKPEKTDKEAGE